jgi:Uma2 family endonuclease
MMFAGSLLLGRRAMLKTQLNQTEAVSPEGAVQSEEFDVGEPTWEIAHLFPTQGHWGEEEYLDLDTNHLIEFSHGRLEVLVMPSELHQDLVILLYNLLKQFVAPLNLGKVMLAPRPLRVWPGKFREPDVMFMFQEHAQRRTQRYWIGADLVMEVISPDDRKRDVVDKRREYAQAGIPEYWLVDPEVQVITVLRLDNQRYEAHGLFGPGESATSALLSGFVVDVTALFAAANE